MGRRESSTSDFSAVLRSLETLVGQEIWNNEASKPQIQILYFVREVVNDVDFFLFLQLPTCSWNNLGIS